MSQCVICSPVWRFVPRDRSAAKGPFPSTARASLVSKLFIIWHPGFRWCLLSLHIKSFHIFRIIKLAWRMFIFLVHLWKFGKLSIFLASSGSFTSKNDNIHSVFLFAVLVANFKFAGFAPNKNTQVGLFPWKRSLLQNPERERTNQSTGLCLRHIINTFKY